MGAMNSVGIGHLCIFIIYCDDAKIPFRNELPSKSLYEMQRLNQILHPNISQMGDSGSNFIRLSSVNNCTKCCLQFVGAKFCKFSIVAVQSIIYET